MGQAEKESFWQEYDLNADVLSQALSKLTGKQNSAEGLTDSFSQQAAIKMMEEAMEALAQDYVSHLEGFKSALEPMAMLAHLERSEVLWQKNAATIISHDPNGEEAEFIRRMRGLALTVFLDKLEEVADAAGRNATQENLACTIALLALVDAVWAEQGRPVDDPERQELRAIAKSFQ